jgi:hypothetical protein
MAAPPTGTPVSTGHVGSPKLLRHLSVAPDPSEQA